MSIFNFYARYYDLLYRDKDYVGEARFIHNLIFRHTSSVHHLLELGCGTGRHAVELARLGLKVDGVDRSREMVSQALNRAQQQPPEISSRLRFHVGDVRGIRLDVEVDAVISLFHVVSYQNTNADLLNMFVTARQHLRPGGLFVFDAWYGPAVLTNQPAIRIKELEDDSVRITRIASPDMHPSANLVDVNYRIIACDKKTSQCEEVTECHHMRYLFTPEIEMIATQAGLTLLDSLEWMTGRLPGFDTWGVCFVASA